MRLIDVSCVQEKAVLAQSVHNSDGKVLLRAGAELNDSLLRRLRLLGITYLYIEDERTDDIIVEPAIRSETRQQAVSVMTEAFKEAETALLTDRGSFHFHKMEKQFSNIVREILSQVSSRAEAVDLLTHLYVHDDYIFSHSLNVTIYTLALAEKLKTLSAKQKEEIGLGAMLHDIGKTVVPVSILTKPGRLTKEEFDIIKQHPEAGFNLLRKEHTFPLTAAHCAFQHHERLDGSGYPRGLKGNDIHLFGKILGIADVYDAVTSNRSYRKAMLPHEGMEILYAGAGESFDLQFVETFRKAIVLYPNGLTVELNDGRRGVVKSQNAYLSDRPVIRILEEEGQQISVPYDVELATETTLLIQETDTTLQQSR